MDTRHEDELARRRGRAGETAHIKRRVETIVAKGREAPGSAGTRSEAGRLFRDVLCDRPLLVIVVLATAAYVIARFGSVRALGTAAKMGGQAVELAGELGGV